MDALRLVVVPIAVIAVTVSPGTGAASADPPPTQVITTIAVGSKGQAVNGYQETPPDGNVPVVNDCSTPSPSAVAANVYACSPSAAGAATCWPSTPGSLLCVDNPWDERLHRVAYHGQLPPVQPTASPEPFALELDDGTHCLLRNGGSWGGRDDGYVGAYGCGNSGANPAVLSLAEPRRWQRHRPLGAGVDGQSRSAGRTGRPLSAATDPRRNERVVRRRSDSGQLERPAGFASLGSRSLECSRLAYH